MTFKKHLMVCLTIATMSVPIVQAQTSEQCSWYGRTIYPICDNKNDGWSKENGKKCVSKNTCINGQPSNRGGIVNDSSGDSGDSGGSTGNDVPSGFTFAVNEGGTVKVNGKFDVVYGAKGKFKRLNNRSSNLACNNSTFGDPIKGTLKACYTKAASDDGSGSGDDSANNNSGFDFPRPSASCSNSGNNIPNNIQAHNIFDSTIARSDFSDITKWYKEDGDAQRFQLHDGDQNQRTSIKRPRLETFSPRWKRGSKSTWHEFSADYYLSDWDEEQLYAIFQIKTNDQSNFIIQGHIRKDGKLQIVRRGKGGVTIANNVYRKPFNLRIRSTGYKFEVYLDCNLVLAEDHPQPWNEDSNTEYGFRWGLYRQQTSEDKQIGTTTMYVTGPKFN